AVAAGGAPSPTPAVRGDGADTTRICTLRNRHGLHARPAAQLARIAGAYGVTLHLGEATAERLVDARSVLAVVAPGLRGGSAGRIAVAGRRASEAVPAIEAAIEDGFGRPALQPTPR